MCMKAIQVMFDEQLLRLLADSPDVKQNGRSAVVRRAVQLYLRQRERERIAQEYRNAYSDTADLDQELGGWAGEGEWPAD